MANPDVDSDLTDRERWMMQGFNAAITSLAFYLRENDLLDYEKLALVCEVHLDELSRLQAPVLQRIPLSLLVDWLRTPGP